MKNMKQKTNGPLSDYSPLRDSGTQIILAYGLKKQADGDLYEWREVYLPKTQNAMLTLDIVKQAILQDINQRTDERILSGFVWTPEGSATAIPVWLSTENQFNFKSAYDLAVQKQGATLPVTFKMGEDEEGNPVYHTFETMADADDFYLKAVSYINQTLLDGWQEKDSIDWTEYATFFPVTAAASASTE